MAPPERKRSSWERYADEHPDVASLIRTKVDSLFPNGEYVQDLLVQFLAEALENPVPEEALLMAATAIKEVKKRVDRPTYMRLASIREWREFCGKYSQRILKEQLL